jgi:hypothetical protein
MTFPHLFAPGRFDAAGAPAGGDGGGRGVAVPFSVPALAHLACTPAVAPNLARVLANFRRGARDRASSVLWRFQGEGRGSRGGAAVGVEDCESALAGLLDDFSPQDAGE